MTRIEVVVAALIAGASASSAGRPAASVTEAYGALRDRLHRRLARHEGVEEPLDAAEDWQRDLRHRLTETLEDARDALDDETLRAAHRVLALADPVGYAGATDLPDAEPDGSAETLAHMREAVTRLAAHTGVPQAVALQRAIATETFLRRLAGRGRKILVEDRRGRLRHLEFPEG